MTPEEAKSRRELIRKLEQAEGPSRELDAEIAAFFFTPEEAKSLGWCHSLTQLRNGLNVVPSFTGSFDAAMMLVPVGVMDWDFKLRNGGCFKATFYRPSEEFEGRGRLLETAIAAAAICSIGRKPS